MSEKTLLVLCSSSYTIDPVFNEVARDVIRAAHKRGYSFVSGGAIKGTMGVVSEEANFLGAYHVGVIPRFMSQYQYPELSKVIFTDTMAERKEKMREEGRTMALALPGGIGTMDELFETYTLSKLEKYSGKVVAFNYQGYYNKLKDLLDFFVSKEMLDDKSRALIAFPETIEELEKLF